MASGNYFKDKSVIVTGGARGVGRELCIELQRLGAKVYAVAKTPENLKALQEEYPTIQTVAVDLGDWDATREAIEKLETVDMLVNNAAVLPPGNFLNSTPEAFDLACSVNLKAVINVSQVVAKKMIADNRPGSIVNVSAITGMKAFPGMSTYSLLKAGLDHLTKIMSIELGPHNIRVNSVNPGPINTEMLRQHRKDAVGPMKQLVERYDSRVSLQQKIAEIDEVVRPILFLLSDSAAMITGTLIPIEGGYNVS